MLSALHDPCQAGQSKGTSAAVASLPAAAARRAPGSPHPVAPVSQAGFPPSARILAFPAAAARATWPLPARAVPATAPVVAKEASRTAAGPQHPQPRAATYPAADVARCLTLADRLALLAWTSGGTGSYTRVVLEDGVPGAAPDRGGYVLLYQRDDRWATLGLTRRAAGVLVWRCSDGSALGSYPTMAEALAALPPTDRIP